MAEAKVSCSLSHPNIVRVHDVGMSGGYYYLSMERLYGHTLRQRIEAYHRDNREFSIEEVAEIARQLIDALRYAHRYIVHRDIKPENIWLAEDGTVKLMDFGIARAFSASQLTQTGVTLGTAYYMAPEQRVAAKEVDWRADQYALGVVLYELLAGTLPTGAVRSLDELRRDVPKRHARALMRAMAPKPQDRFASLAELFTEIGAPRRKAAGLGALLLIGAGVAAAVGVTFVVMNREAPPVQGEAPAPATVAQTGQQNGDAGPPTTPPTTPPPTQPEAAAPASPQPEEASTQAQTVPAETKPEVSEPAPSPQTQAPAPQSTRPAPAPTHVAVVDTYRQECIKQCERDDGECRSINRRAKQDCMRAVAFNGTGRMSTTPYSASCAFYDESRCVGAYDRDACRTRLADRYRVCVGVLGDSIASRRQDCEDTSHEADRLCMDDLRDCRASCQ
jgi:serine/threonine protein kinase